ncbi:MAG: lipid A export permease/ATP-binding protein MsbA [Proteobacteria bacterium]|nr:lipid A export permease/ATP-binding protein MsbA [Pseudomonadota bacterium]
MVNRPQVKLANRQSDWHLYARLMTYVAPYWYIFLFSILGYVVYSLGNVLLADMMQFLLDALSPSENVKPGFVARAAHAVYSPGDMGAQEYARIAVPLTAVALAFMRAMGFFVGTYFMNHIARNLVHALRCELFDKMLVAPSSYYDGHSSGVLISKITYNVEQVTGAATKALKIIVREGLTIVALLSYMIYLNWRLCLVFFVVAPLIAFVVTIVGKHFRRYSRRIQDSMGEVTQVSSESIGAYKEVRIFGGQAHQQSLFHNASVYNRSQSLKLAFAEAVSTPVIQTLLSSALAVLIYFAMAPDVMEGFSAGLLVAFLTAAAQLGKPVRQLSSIQSVLQRGLAAAEDIFAQLDYDDEDDSGTVQVDRARGEISISKLSFAYAGNTEAALKNISLTISPGQTVALVGRSGSGKSTLVNLLARFYAPSSGSISLDGIELQDYQLSNLRSQFSIVSQNVSLFHDTVLHNIAYGQMAGASEAAVRKAAESAYALEFIENLPQGFETVLGEDGAGLSGGQRQRLAIARAILKDAPVLILDEATSALDNESEYRIQQALENIMLGRTTLVIAHRLSTVEHADSIVVMDNGEIVATGSHAQLLEQGGLYSQLYHQEFTD